MNKVRNLLCIPLVLLLTAFALPSSAAPQFTKQFHLEMASLAPLQVTAYLTNVTPQKTTGNSSISSFQLTASGAIITGFDPLPSGTATIDPSGTSIFIQGMSPLKPGDPPYVVTLHLGDCGDISWTAQAWTGNMGQPFAPLNTTFPIHTLVACANVACGDTFTVPDSFDP